MADPAIPLYSSRDEQLFAVAKASLPRFLFQGKASKQELYWAYAKIFGRAWDTVADWIDNTYLLKSSGFWVDQHAADRGTRRQAGEGDAAVIARLRNVEDAVTPVALLAAVNKLLVAAGVTTSATLVELRGARAFFRPSTGGTARAFWGRGDRWARNLKNTIIFVLPYGTPPDVAAAVLELVDQKRAGGVAAFVETRATAERLLLSMTPPAVQLSPATTQQFTVQALHGAATVTWAIASAAGGVVPGSINSTGLYTAPAFSAANYPDVIVTATSTIDTAVQATARIKLVP